MSAVAPSEAVENREVLTALRPVRLLAAFACVITVCAAAIIPAMHGWMVGMSKFLELADDNVDRMSQALALFLLFGVGGLVVQLLVSRAPITLRAAGVLLAALAGFAALTNVGLDRLPILNAIHAVICGCASVVAIVFGADVLRGGSIAGGVPIAIGLASLARGIGAYLAERAAAERKDVEAMRSAFERAQTLSTIAAILAGAACVTAVVWAIRIDKLRGAILGGGAGLIALLLAWRGSAPVDDTESAWSVLLRRIAQEMTTRPQPLLPPFLVIVLAVLPTIVACFCLATTKRLSIAGAALSLALLAGASAEVPLLGLCLTAGALALSLDRRDPHGVFAALSNAPRMSAAPTIAPEPPGEPAPAFEPVRLDGDSAAPPGGELQPDAPQAASDREPASKDVVDAPPA